MYNKVTDAEISAGTEKLKQLFRACFQDEYRIPKLMFFMCLYGYSTQQIADKLILLGKRSYKGNIKWTASGVVQTLRNERYCGDVFTRKTFTPDVISHRSRKNRGERPRSRYLDEHQSRCLSVSHVS